jgi:SAM-dependent methyltransferase
MKIDNLIGSKFVQRLIKPLVPPSVRKGAWESLRMFKRLLRGQVGYVDVQWGRVMYIQHWQRFLSTLPTERLSLLEISPGPVSMWRERGWASYTGVQYPAFDIMNETLQDKFDVIFAEHVFEHLRHPYAAARNIRAMLKDDGVFIIATPFLVRIHNEPGDYTRWSELGIAGLLEDTGFTAETHSWGNQKCVIANFQQWERFRKGRDLQNESDLPLVVWAYARKA